MYDEYKMFGIIIMCIGILIELYSLIMSMYYFDLGALIFLAGLIVNNVYVHKELREYRNRYGELV